MLDEVEEKLQRRDRDVADLKVNAKWHEGTIARLSDELSQARGEVEDKQSRINALQERVELVRADKARARGEVEELTKRLARQKEEMAKLELDNRALQGELASSRDRSLELEARAGESEEQIVLLRAQVVETEGQVALSRSQMAEAEMRLAMLKGEQDVICSDAFQLGVEECRNKISSEHPEWDLSFLDAEALDVSDSGGEEEDEYIDASDTDLGTAPGPSEAAASGGHSQTVAKEAKTLEKGESSRASAGAIEGFPGTDTAPGS